jgi:colanic acid biosynthesis protein WcaH
MPFIPEEDYKKILNTMPIPCVDLVVRWQGKLLMVYRDNKPAKGQWWLPGGRVLKNEKLEHAALRKLKEETGLSGTIVKQVGAYDTMFDDAPFEDVNGVHSINTVYLIDVDGAEVKLDELHSKFQWFDHVDEQWHPVVKQVLNDCGFFEEE